MRHSTFGGNNHFQNNQNDIKKEQPKANISDENRNIGVILYADSDNANLANDSPDAGIA